jgi:branched-chain amino acid transport system permease protein
MSLALQVFVTGLGAGGVYGLVAIGHTLIYRLTGIVHFALGDLIGLGVFSTLRRSDTIYVFSTRIVGAPDAAAPASGNGSNPLWIVLATGLVVLTAGGLVVLWAHS